MHGKTCPLVRLAAALLGLLALLLLTQYAFLFDRSLSRIHSSAATLRPETSLVVPPLVHYTWYSLHRHTFRFHHFLSVLSAHRFLRPRRIFFWCGSTPRGKWWLMARRRVPELNVRIHAPPTRIFNRPIRIPEHQSDVVRLMALQRFGGIYLDLDVLVLRSFRPLRRYNITMGYQLDRSGLCNGVIVARPRDRFIELWFKEYHYFLDRLWDYHSVRLPDLLATRYPSLIHVEERTFHRPNFMERSWIYDTDKIYAWRGNFAMHLWYRFYNVDHNPEDIKGLNSTLGHMFRYIYYGSV